MPKIRVWSGTKIGPRTRVKTLNYTGLSSSKPTRKLGWSRDALSQSKLGFGARISIRFCQGNRIELQMTIWISNTELKVLKSIMLRNTNRFFRKYIFRMLFRLCISRCLIDLTWNNIPAPLKKSEELNNANWGRIDGNINCRCSLTWPRWITIYNYGHWSVVDWDRKIADIILN